MSIMSVMIDSVKGGTGVPVRPRRRAASRCAAVLILLHHLGPATYPFTSPKGTRSGSWVASAGTTSFPSGSKWAEFSRGIGVPVDEQA